MWCFHQVVYAHTDAISIIDMSHQRHRATPLRTVWDVELLSCRFHGYRNFLLPLLTPIALPKNTQQAMSLLQGEQPNNSVVTVMCSSVEISMFQLARSAGLEPTTF
jgi:hypothetical protein